MQNGFALLLIFFSCFTFAQTEPVRPSLPQNITRFAFGSCSDQRQAQPLWKPIMDAKPDFWLWGGDIIYADWERTFNLKASYDKQKSHPVYQQLLSQIPVLGMWDDHDFGTDNADGTFSLKKDSQKAFLDFLEEPEGSPRRQREGVYHSYNFGQDDKQIKLIMLDNRYFKNLDFAGSFLGETQWQWLEEELKNSQASVHFIMAGLSITSPLIPYTEEWAEHPTDMNRLMKMIGTYQTKGVVFLTGDKHFASIFRRWGHLEFMSSGMTHISNRKTWWYLGRKYETSYFGLNYGLVDIAWEGNTPIISLSIKDTNNRSIFPRSFKWNGIKWDIQGNVAGGMIIGANAENETEEAVERRLPQQGALD